MPYSGQTGVVARCDDSRRTWSETSRPYLNESAHAAEACTLTVASQMVEAGAGAQVDCCAAIGLAGFRAGARVPGLLVTWLRRVGIDLAGVGWWGELYGWPGGFCWP
jgi:hypothetical protein